ncbi:MAG: hypothetical protein AB7O39_09795 [Flavobacteriaceae bacterium]
MGAQFEVGADVSIGSLDSFGLFSSSITPGRALKHSKILDSGDNVIYVLVFAVVPEIIAIDQGADHSAKKL